MLFFDDEIEPIPTLDGLFDNLLARGARPKRYQGETHPLAPKFQPPPMSPAAMHEAVARRDARTRELNKPEPKGFVERAVEVFEAAVDVVASVVTLKGKHFAAAWLRERLSAGPLPAAETERAARDAGISGTALRRGRKMLGIRAYQSNRTWFWSLPAGSIGQGD